MLAAATKAGYSGSTPIFDCKLRIQIDTENEVTSKIYFPSFHKVLKRNS